MAMYGLLLAARNPSLSRVQVPPLYLGDQISTSQKRMKKLNDEVRPEVIRDPNTAG